LYRGKTEPDLMLKLGKSASERHEIALDERREQFQEHRAAEAVRRAARDGRQLRERRGLQGPVEGGPVLRGHEEDRPVVRKRLARQQGWNGAMKPAAAVDQEAAVSETVKADPGPESSAGEPGEPLERHVVLAREEEHGVGDGQTELSSHPQPRVLARGRFHVKSDARGADLGGDGACDSQNALGKGSACAPVGRDPGRESNLRVLDHQADAAELARGAGAPPEESEMEPCGCLYA
jgi:hypothetical protein